MPDHQGQITLPARVVRGPVFVSVIISYSLAYDVSDVTDDNNSATALSVQIQVSFCYILTKAFG